MSDTINTLLRQLPSVDQFLSQAAVKALQLEFGAPLVKSCLRDVLADNRQHILSGTQTTAPASETLIAQLSRHLDRKTQSSLYPIINATGVIIHTNLGRAPLSDAAQAAMQAVARDYNTLEFDMHTGKRGKRTRHAQALLQELTGAEAALIVNNCASGLILILSALAKRKGVAISRGQLVEIGGGFRVPDIMKQSGAKLVEVGTTNRTHLRDFETVLADEAHRPKVGMLLRAHSSNFRVIGFTTQPTLAELVTLGHQHGVLVADDLGSGSLLQTADFGLAPEPTVQDSIAAGVDVLSFSGDKLLGGPQAGIILGKKAVVAKLAKHPLTRAIRPDKITLAALTATLLHYLKGEATQHVPIWRMISMPLADLTSVAQHWQQAWGERATCIAGVSTVGGGSLPEETLPTTLVALTVRKPDRFMKQLRSEKIIARILDQKVVFDPRTVSAEQIDLVKTRVGQLLAKHPA